MKRNKWIVIAGNPVDGLEFHGPFDSTHDAVEYANEEIRDEWWLGKLQPFSEGEDSEQISVADAADDCN